MKSVLSRSGGRLTKGNVLIWLLVGAACAGTTGLISYFAGKSQAPTIFLGGTPRTNPEQVDELPEEDTGDIELVSDLSVFDLRAWSMPSKGKPSPVYYVNHLGARTKTPKAKMRMHLGTSGERIDIRCLTHEFKVLQRRPDASHEGLVYAIEIDLDNEKAGSLENVIIESTYWNGWRDDNSGDASTYTSKDVEALEKLELLVLLPPGKSASSADTFLHGEKDDDTEYEAGPGEFEWQRDPSVLYWRVRDIQPSKHYELVWKW